MTPEAAAAEFWATIDAVTSHAPVARRHERAARALKDHMAGRGLHTFQGIKLEEFPGGSRLDMDALYEKFGRTKVDACRRDTTSRRLLPWKRPKKLAA